MGNAPEGDFHDVFENRGEAGGVVFIDVWGRHTTWRMDGVLVGKIEDRAGEPKASEKVMLGLTVGRSKESPAEDG